MHRRFGQVALVLLSGCTQDFGVFERDSGSASDAVADSASDSNSVADSASDSGSVADSGPKTCDAGAVVCVYCATSGSATTSTCSSFHQTCSGGAPSGFMGCACTTASSCPNPEDVCRNNTCRPCGDSTNNGGQTCKGGGTCSGATGTCN